MVALAKFSFEKAKSITDERNKLFAKIQEAGESLKSLHAALTAQAAKAELGTIEDELVRDLFISKTKITALQDTLTFKTFTPDENLKIALKYERSKQTRQAFQKSYANTAGTGSLMGSQLKIKQELNMEVGNRGGSSRRSNKKPYKRRTWDAKSNTKSRADQKQCTRRQKPLGEGYLKNCPAMGKTCKNFNIQITLLECVGHSSSTRSQRNYLVQKKNVISSQVLIPAMTTRSWWSKKRICP